MTTSKFMLSVVAVSAGVVLAHAETSEQGRIRTAVGKAVVKGLESGPSFVKVSGCVSCHNNTLPVIAATMARSRGIPVNEDLERQQMKAITGVMSPAREILLEATYSLPDVQVFVPNVLMALYAEHVPANDFTAAAVHAIAAKQLPDGRWPSYVNRAPMENGDIQATALSVRALQIYGMPGRSAEWERRIGDAREWLSKATAKTTADKTMLVAGLAWSGAAKEMIAHAAQVLLDEQREDGGWAQLATLDSDAYATGTTLVALHEAGMLKPGDDVYRRGVAYLLKSQMEDGTWLVKSRAFPFQPLKESGFPHGRDQWISGAATSWAAMALAYALEPAPQMTAAAVVATSRP